MRLGVVRTQANRLAVTCHRVICPRQLGKYKAEARPALRIVWSQLQGVTIAGLRFLQPSQFAERKSPIVVKVGTIRLKLDGVLIATEGGRVMTEAAKGIAQIEVCLGVLWPQMQGPQIAGDSFIHASQIGQCSTQIVVALRMRRCDLQDLLVVRRRLGKLPGPVAVVAPVEQLSRPGNCFG